MSTLPTYQAATRKQGRRDVFELVTKYIQDAGDLFQCCLVDREWNDLFMVLLWDNPLSKVRGSSKYAQEIVRVILIPSPAKFIRLYNSIPFTRGASRIRIVDGRQCFRYCGGVCHCNSSDMAIHIVAPRRESLAPHLSTREFERDIMPTTPKTIEAAIQLLAISRHLINARYLILDRQEVQNDAEGSNLMEIWNHQSLLVLSLNRARQPLEGFASMYPKNFPCIQRLRYLDLSNSMSMNIAKPSLSMFGVFANMVVLKLRGCGVRDQDVSFLRRVQVRRGQLTCLDLRDNLLTDRCYRDLARLVDDESTPPNDYPIYPYRICTQVEAAPDYNVDPPAPADPECQSSIRLDPAASAIPDDLDDFIAYVRDHGNLDTVPNTEMRQMYMSGNEIGFQILGMMLLARSSMQTFDYDGPPVDFEGDSWWRATSIHLQDSEQTLDRSPIPAAVALCSYQHAPKLERLTIHHSFVTYSPRTQEQNIRRYDMIPAQERGVVATPNEMWRFLPEVNNNLQYLELLGVPAWGSPELLQALIVFLKGAAKQENRLRQYRLANPASRRSPRVLAGLKKLKIRLTNKLEEDLISATEDLDAERFMRESENDFSFFEDERGRGRRTTQDEEVERQRRERVDIRAGIAEYRRKTREDLAETVEKYGAEHAWKYADLNFPHWGGILTVVRPCE